MSPARTANRDAQPLRDRLVLADVHDVQVVLRDLSGRDLAVPAPAANWSSLLVP